MTSRAVVHTYWRRPPRERMGTAIALSAHIQPEDHSIPNTVKRLSASKSLAVFSEMVKYFCRGP